MAYTDYEMSLIEEIEVENYRALRKLHLKQLEPLTAFIGPNGGGKSTLLDVFAFLAECFEDGLTQALDRRGGFRHIRTRGSTEPIAIKIKWRERRRTTMVTYYLEIDEKDHRPVVTEEWLQWKRGSHSTGRPFRFFNFTAGSGRVISGEEGDARIEATLDSPDLLAISTFGHLTDHARINRLLEFVKELALAPARRR